MSEQKRVHSISPTIGRHSDVPLPVCPLDYYCHNCNAAVLNSSPKLHSGGGGAVRSAAIQWARGVNPSQGPYGVYPPCRLAPPADVAVTGSPTLLSTLRDAVLGVFQPGLHRPAPR